MIEVPYTLRAVPVMNVCVVLGEGGEIKVASPFYYRLHRSSVDWYALSTLRKATDLWAPTHCQLLLDVL